MSSQIHDSYARFKIIKVKIFDLSKIVKVSITTLNIISKMVWKVSEGVQQIKKIFFLWL